MYVGKIIALSILHGGPGPSFFSPAVIDYLFGGIPMVKACVDDVPDAALQTKINKVFTVHSRHYCWALKGVFYGG